VVVCVAGFWACAAAGARSEPGYDPQLDYLSGLASVGAAQPGWGLAMFAFGSGAVLATAVLVGNLVPSAVVAQRLLLLAAVLVAVAGVARVTCLDGAAACSAGPRVVDRATVLHYTHSAAVTVYVLVFAVAMAALARAASRASRPALAALAWAAAVVTPLLGLAPLPWGPGTDQRVWVAAGHVLLLALAAWPPAAPPPSAAPASAASAAAAAAAPAPGQGLRGGPGEACGETRGEARGAGHGEGGAGRGGAGRRTPEGLRKEPGEARGTQ
jgi:hypothetical protein